MVELDVMEANLRRCQSYLDGHGLALRPHIKTHKIPEFARQQVALGAKGITCQKLGEAEVMIKAEAPAPARGLVSPGPLHRSSARGRSSHVAAGLPPREKRNHRPNAREAIALH